MIKSIATGFVFGARAAEMALQENRLAHTPAITERINQHFQLLAGLIGRDQTSAREPTHSAFAGVSAHATN